MESIGDTMNTEVIKLMSQPDQSVQFWRDSWNRLAADIEYFFDIHTQAARDNHEDSADITIESINEFLEKTGLSKLRISYSGRATISFDFENIEAADEDELKDIIESQTSLPFNSCVWAGTKVQIEKQ